MKTSNTDHLVVISGNDSSLPVKRPLDVTITLIQSPDRATDFQRNYVDRFIEVPNITADSLTETLCSVLESGPITALVCFLEPVILAAALAADRLGIPSNPLSAVKTARDKVLTHQALDRCGIPQKPWRHCRTIEHARKFRDSLNGAPMVVKPVTGAGSAGVRLVRSDTDLVAAWQGIENLKPWALLDNPDQSMIAQAVLPGTEVSVEAMSIDGHHEVVAITGKLNTGAPGFVELGHWQPAALTADQKFAVTQRTCETLSAIGHTIGPSHTEVMVDVGDVWLVETHTRFGGDHIWELTELTTGRHMATETIFAILGRPIPCPASHHGGAAIRLLDWAPPTSIDRLAGAEGVVSVSPPWATSGGRSASLQDSSDMTGHIITTGNDADKAWSLAESLAAAARGNPDD